MSDLHHKCIVHMYLSKNDIGKASYSIVMCIIHRLKQKFQLQRIKLMFHFKYALWVPMARNQMLLLFSEMNIILSIISTRVLIYFYSTNTTLPLPHAFYNIVVKLFVKAFVPLKMYNVFCGRFHPC